MKNKHRKKKVLMAITCLLIIIECTTVFLMYKSLNNKDAVLDEVKLVSGSNNSGMFAIMLENADGEYEPSENNAWPTNGYAFNSERSGCMDSNGNEVPGALEYDNGVARIKTNKKVSCYMYFDIGLEAFAIYSETDNSLRFYKNDDEVEVGDTYNDLVVTSKYTGIEESAFDSQTIPWEDYRNLIKTVVVEEKISPISTNSWFFFVENVESIDLTNLDTSNVTDMSTMFGVTSNKGNTFMLLGLENWDTSNVTSMSEMFNEAMIENELDLSKWNTTKVTDMSWMFSFSLVSKISISSWDTSNVTNMSYMFMGAITSYTAENPLDLSGWDVSNVTSYDDFIRDIDPADSIIAPNFGTTS